MILEVAILEVIPQQTLSFEKDFEKASAIISSMKGYHGHQLQRCLEVSNRYLLLVNWEELTDHTIGFRQSAAYLDWKALLHQYYDPFPTVEHYEMVYSGSITNLSSGSANFNPGSLNEQSDDAEQSRSAAV
ncbi:antibiotic biosynthesis monooxygenase [Pedobacter sp. PLR]|uniref:antibiotic biosynthesis monooxygenase family protein n=1 Tax=Pedobacter sp. PLR TaxID=2994465 RepID=UPI0022462E7D|nr:antibiotic biosynthesis monooxygenase [Pedobacter sp. PLR]MCX2453462.1 antibiotic biosynthesis monooxygenase [Pedobacter sp. PLR]